MKWENPGHEYDEIGRVFEASEELLVWGPGTEAADLMARLCALGLRARVISDVPSLRILGWTGEEVLPPQHALYSAERKIAVLCLPPEQEEEVFRRLACAGYQREKNCFTYQEFTSKWLSVYAVYKKDKVFFNDVSLIPSTKCNLRCAACLNFTTYLKKMIDEPIDELKTHVDVFFSKVDYIGLFHVSGGEPFLYPHLGELLAYIDERYRDRIHQLATTTNGSIVCSDELCGALRDHRVLLLVDDYTDALPSSRNTFDALRARLERNGVWHWINKAEYWIDIAPDRTDNNGMSESELISHKSACGIPYREYHKGRLYACNYANYAEKAGLCVGEPDESIDLASWPRNKNKELVEFRLGYTRKGYVNFCKKCAGFFNNPYRLPPAEQLR